MSNELLKKCFKGVAAKRLSAVEADIRRSNQHEFNGCKLLRNLLGEDKKKYAAVFIWLDSNEEDRDEEYIEKISEKGTLTWYDSREKSPAGRDAEFRFYYSGTSFSSKMSESDLVVFALRPDDTIYVISTKAFSTIESKLIWLFDLNKIFDPKYQTSKSKFITGSLDIHGQNTEFLIRKILAKLDINVEPRIENSNLLDLMIERFGSDFPSTNEFSCFARETFAKSDELYDADNCLLSWFNHETDLFFLFEKYIYGPIIKKGFRINNDIDMNNFIEVALSIINRRKARAGYALENHLEQVFLDSGLKFERNALTEKKNKPDFLFPGKLQYDDETFPDNKLFMLGAKTTLKDRWRQVTKEANRIKEKHLFTLEEGVSENQIKQMKDEKLILVVPKELHGTFSKENQISLISLTDFIKQVKANLT